MDLGIEGKVALVMGASKGIGRGIASSLAREGARVAVASRSPERIEEAAAELTGEHGVEVRGYAADTNYLDSLPDLIDSVRSDIGPVEILITNTGGPPLGELLKFDRQEWEQAYRSLVLAPLELIKAAVPDMRQRGFGRIVNVTSLTTREPIQGFALSNSHRLAAVGAFKTLATELGREGILVNSVAPGRIATDRIASTVGRPLEEIAREPQPDIPVGRLGTAEEVGDAVAFLCSQRASYVTGVNLLVDGGLVRSI